MTDRKIHAMHRLYGTCGVMRCKDCNHLICGKYHDRRYYKCELYGISHSEATDWRVSYQACGMYNTETPFGFVPVLKQIAHVPDNRNVVLDGQMRLEVDNGQA